MLRPLSCLFSLAFSFAAAAPGPQPLRVTGRILAPVPADVRIELVPVVSGYSEAVRLLAGEPIPPLVTAQPRPDGSFEITAPESGLYRVRLRADGRLPVEVLLIPLAEDTELPPVALQPAPPVEFFAVGPDGQPVPRLRLRALSVQAFGLAPQIAWRPAQSEGMTDAAGKVTLPQGGVRELSLVALAPGVPDRFVETIDGNRHTLHLKRSEPRAVEVRGKDGKPLAGVLVRWNLMPFGFTGSDGRLALPASTAGATLRLEDAGGFLAEVPVPPEEKGPEEKEIIAVRLPAGRTVSGRVLDAASRAPLAGALLWGGDHRHVRTAVDGRFSLRVFGTGEATVDAAASGHLPSSIEARPGDSQPMTLVLRPAAALDGIVADGAGEPVAGAEIRARRADGRIEDSPMQVPELSGAGGRFRLAGLAAGQSYEITARREGFVTAILPVDAAPAGKGAPLRIVLRRGATASGRVVDAAGEPVAGAGLILRSASRPMRSPEMEAHSDATGHFHFADLGPGLFDLRASGRGFAARVVRGIEAPVDLGDVVLAPGAAIEGRVTDRHGAPIAKAEADLSCSDDFLWGMSRAPRREPVATGADGRFRFEDRTPGTPCHLEIRCAGYAPARLPGVQAPTREPLRIELATARVLSGRVVGPQGEPVPRATFSLNESQEVRINGGGVTTRSSQGSGRTDAEGRFRLGELTAGPFDLIVSAPGYKERTVQGIEIPEAGGSPLEIALARGETLAGKAVDSQGRPVDGATIYVTSDKTLAMDLQQAAGFTDGDGRYRLEGLEAARYSATAESPDGQSVKASVQVKPGVNQLDFTFPGGTGVEGRVLDRDGVPLPGATVSLRAVPEGRVFRAAAGTEGFFRIKAVADGDYLLAGLAEGFARTIRPGEIHVSGQPIRGLELRLDRGAVLTGKIIGVAPEELPLGAIHAFSPGSRSFFPQAVITGEGYRIAGLSPGTWEVMAVASGGRSTHGSVVIEPGMERATLDLEFTAGFTLSGRVLLDGAPLGEAQVLVRNAPGSSPNGGGSTTTAWDGGFRIAGLAPGRYRVVIANRTGIGHMDEIEISGDREATFDIATGSLGGEVLSAAGAPVAGVLVSLSGENPTLASMFAGPTLRSDEQGRFEVSRLAAGSYRVTVQKEGFAPAESRVVVTPGGTVQMQVVLKEAR